MLKTHLKRIVRSGTVGFARNSFVSLSSVLMITITLFVVGSLIFFSALMDATLEEIQKRVDITVTLSMSASEAEIGDLKHKIESLPEVESVVYQSRDEAIAEFRERHADDFLTIQALDELGTNPLGSRLNVRAKETSQYERIARFLDREEGLAGGEKKIIDRINYYRNKPSIDRLTTIIEGVEKIGWAVVLVLAFTSFAITFNTIRLAIYTSREEISVMRLVGASKKYIQGPFMIEGALYGFAAGILTMLLFYPFTKWLGDATAHFFGGINIYDYYVSNFFQIFAIIMGVGIALGVLSSFFSVQRYLRKKYLRS